MHPNLQALRRSALSCGLALFVAGASEAVEVELGLVTGGQQTGSIGTREGTLGLAGGLLFGASVGWRVQPDGIVELAWSRQPPPPPMPPAPEPAPVAPN